MEPYTYSAAGHSTALTQFRHAVPYRTTRLAHIKRPGNCLVPWGLLPPHRFNSGFRILDQIRDVSGHEKRITNEPRAAAT